MELPNWLPGWRVSQGRRAEGEQAKALEAGWPFWVKQSAESRDSAVFGRVNAKEAQDADHLESLLRKR